MGVGSSTLETFGNVWGLDMQLHCLRYRFVAGALAGMLSLLGGVAQSSDVGMPGSDGRAQIARSDGFAVAEAFAVGGRIGDHAVSAVGFNFQTYFFPLVETDDVASPADLWTLGRSADDATLIAMIGGEDKVAVSLSAIHRIIARGDRRDSHTDGKSNFAYARSPVDGRLWAIHWTLNAADQWVVGAVYVPHPDLDWPAGARLFAPRIGSEEARSEKCSVLARLACLARP
jgi:hypothetical protein